jgi:hypothetical protein
VEASSPVLIENLRSGSYTVTFTFPGFSPVKRERIELVGAFIATVNADMKAGDVAEAITVDQLARRDHDQRKPPEHADAGEMAIDGESASAA